jgi:hypothetical protein
MKRVISALLIIILFISCDKRLEYLDMNKSVDLSYGKCFMDSSRILTVCFDSILSDSRCPDGANCIWAGEAIARFNIKVGQNEVRKVDLRLSNDTVINGYKFSFISLNPYPSASQEISVNDYIARIIIYHD